MLIVGSIVIRVDDLDAQIAFWTQALDYVVREPRGDDFALLSPRSGSGPNLSLDAVPAERVLPPRIHLDVSAADGRAAGARLVGRGAARVEWSRMPPDADYVILEDPEGNRFCVIDAAEWSGWARVGARG